MTAFVLVVASAAISLIGWAFAATSQLRRAVGALLAAGLAVAAIATLFEGPIEGDLHDVLVLFALVLAVCGGAVVTTAAFDQIDSDDQDDSMAAAGEMLRGGAWIGALERAGVFLTLAARWPEGVAVVLAIKGLGRYPELRGDREPGATERFIIGTMISMVWAAVCVYVAFAPYSVPLR